jgi:hypothetical protein
MMSVSIRTEPGLSASDPAPVFDLVELRAVSPAWTSVILPDGRLLFAQKGEEERDLTHYNVILNWSQQLEQHDSSGTN